MKSTGVVDHVEVHERLVGCWRGIIGPRPPWGASDLFLARPPCGASDLLLARHLDIATSRSAATFEVALASVVGTETNEELFVIFP